VFGELEVGGGESENFDGRVSVPCAKGKNGTLRTLHSAVVFGPGEEVPHLSSRTARLRATCHRRFSRIAPRYQTPGGSRGSRKMRPNWIHGLWT